MVGFGFFCSVLKKNLNQSSSKTHQPSTSPQRKQRSLFFFFAAREREREREQKRVFNHHVFFTKIII